MKKEPGRMEKPVEQRGRRTRASSTAGKPKVELLDCRTEAETGAWQTRATMEGVKMMGKPEGRRSPVEL